MSKTPKTELVPAEGTAPVPAQNMTFEQQVAGFVSFVRANNGRITIEANGDIAASLVQNGNLMTFTTQNVGGSCLSTNTSISGSASREDKKEQAKKLSKQGLTQTKIGTILGVSQATVHNYLNE
ncbi:helix-turn-helix domain-containing protein [Desulfovibrio sp. OttesenSCG-928-C06]|nr:helix-turn-helix domain-containing protein [Desulfovibrio sp. OttesenSCG-928-C06]